MAISPVSKSTQCQVNCRQHRRPLLAQPRVGLDCYLQRGRTHSVSRPTARRHHPTSNNRKARFASEISANGLSHGCANNGFNSSVSREKCPKASQVRPSRPGVNLRHSPPGRHRTILPQSRSQPRRRRIPTGGRVPGPIRQAAAAVAQAPVSRPQARFSRLGSA